MLETLNMWVVGALDYVLGWILYLPRDAALFVVALLTSSSLTFARKWVTDQEWLGRAAADQERLKELTKQAKGAKDKDAVARYKATLTLIKMRSLKFELSPLLWAIVPVALLATWAFSRLAFVPPRLNEPVEVRAYFPRSAIGQIAHIAPEPGVDAADGWVQPVVADRPAPIENLWDKVNARVAAFCKMTPPLEGVAVWKMVPKDSKLHVLKIRHAGRTYEKELLAGQRRYAPPVTLYPDSPVTAVDLAMKPMKLFGYVGGIDVLFLAPWLVAYLLIAIPFVSILKRVFRIY